MAERIVANPGSTLGEAIGVLVELEVNSLLGPIAEENGCVYVKAGKPNPRTGRPLRESMRETLNNAFPREVSGVEVTVETNLGESRRYAFPSISATLEFLQAFDEQEVFNDENGPALWDTMRPLQ